MFFENTVTENLERIHKEVELIFTTGMTFNKCQDIWTIFGEMQSLLLVNARTNIKVTFNKMAV